MEGYISAYKGSQIDLAVTVILESGITVTELGFMKQSTAGEATSSKVVILDQNKDYSGIRRLSSLYLISRVFQFDNRIDDTIETPPEGKVHPYFKNGGFYYKNSEGNIYTIGGGRKRIYPFENVYSVICNHGFGDQYPSVEVVGLDNQPIGHNKVYTDGNNLTVWFNHQQSGKVIVTTVS